MASRYPSAYYNNPVIGAAIQNLSSAFFGPQLSPEKEAEAAFYRSKTAGQLFENQKRAGLADSFLADPRRAVAEAAAAGITNADELGRYFGIMDPNATQAQRDIAFQAGGGAYTSTAGGQQAALANDLEKQRIANQGNALVQELQNLVLPEGAVRTDEGGNIVAVGANKLTPGQSLSIPNRPMVTAPYAPQNVPEGNILVDPNTRQPVFTGNVAVPQGGSVYLQGGGQPLLGQAKPMSSDELFAQALSENFNSQELAQQAQAKIDPRVTNYRSPTGQVGTARETMNGLIDTVTNQPVPPGSIKFGASVQGAGTDALTNSTESLVQRQLLSGQQAVSQLNQLLKVAQANPTSAGTVGSIRELAQALVTSGTDVANALGGTSRQVQQDLESGLAERGLQTFFFDPSIGQIDLLINGIAYSYAKAMNPTGEVSVKAFETAKRALEGDAMVTSSQDVIARAAAMRDNIQAQMQDLRTLQPGLAGQLPQGVNTPVDPRYTTQQQAPNAAPAPGGVERWVRDPSGRLVPAGP